MIKQIFARLRSVHFETELLEVLDWDNSESEKVMVELSEYFDNHAGNRNIEEVKFDLRLLFPKNVCEVIFKYMNYAANFIIQEGGKDYEA